MGHRQLQFQKTHWKFRTQHGGILRQKRRGRMARPLSTKTSIHLVFKADRKNLHRGLRSPLGFKISTDVLKKYSKRFKVKIQQAAICSDHIHLIVRLSRRSLGQHFFRVVAGQIAQQFKNNGLLVTDTAKVWKLRPFTRVVRGWRGLRILRNYVRLNHLESTGVLPYKKRRLKDLSAHEWGLLWS